MVVIFFSGIVTEKLNDLPATLMYIIYVNVVGHIQKKCITVECGLLGRKGFGPSGGDERG